MTMDWSIRLVMFLAGIVVGVGAVLVATWLRDLETSGDEVATLLAGWDLDEPVPLVPSDAAPEPRPSPSLSGSHDAVMQLIASASLCRCGHPLEMHRHLRNGSDCGKCGPIWCTQFVDDEMADPSDRYS